ncbi:hypothetical protein ACFHWD_15900 [Clostridium sp. MT-14]|jgi:cation transport regulator ChaC|uniref:Uncharacterized protein n=1 Tax=Clostridium aromativorans TaxID=2836848 RepID=A0ABS8N8B8_9CLOT|nr:MULTISPECIES: hypothetical protein [Clostridium]KAA8673293.1 hypothetical protein F3O63_09305 [Clostridium sp. HV4-5-A1G]MCC9294978.1 hypothetical protein [Clostridium aromativorans]CAB1262718.1 conserved hypothetical protein [Clostridiaceae bacterium BL-3]
MLKSSINKAVSSVVSSVEFEKVSDLTKKQFTKILSEAIYEAITNKDYIKEIYQQLPTQIQLEIRAKSDKLI